MFFFFNDTATSEIYTLSLHDALPISRRRRLHGAGDPRGRGAERREAGHRSEEHTSELQSRVDISYAVFCLTKIVPPSARIAIHASTAFSKERTRSNAW